MIPDVEQVVGDYLRDHPGVSAQGAKVFGKAPSSSRTPWVIVTQLDAPDVGHGLEHLTDHMLQLDCYAGADATEDEVGQGVATDLARTCRQALHDLQGTTADTVKVANVRFQGMLRNADTDFEPAMERVILTAEVTVHP